MMSTPALVAFFTGVYIVSFAAYLGVWLQPTGSGKSFENFYSNIYLTIMPFCGGVVGLLRLRCAPSKPRRVVLTIFSVGLLVWAMGSVAWSYYNFRGIETPYPSWADAGYFPQIVLWIVGALAMFRMAGTNVIEEMKTPAAWATAICAGIITVFRWIHAETFKALTPSANPDLVKFAFDIGYPVVEIISAAFFAALVFGASNKLLCTTGHGSERAGYAFFAGALILTAADFFFNFTTSLNPSTYYNGNWVDFVYLSAFYPLTIGIVLFPVDEPPFKWP